MCPEKRTLSSRAWRGDDAPSRMRPMEHIVEFGQGPQRRIGGIRLEDQLANPRRFGFI
jgi:hypothetical protein